MKTNIAIRTVGDVTFVDLKGKITIGAGDLQMREGIRQVLASGTEKSELPHNPMSADRVRWEHIQRIYEMCNRNVSETARRLNMHRRTLQRILAKRAPR